MPIQGVQLFSEKRPREEWDIFPLLLHSRTPFISTPSIRAPIRRILAGWIHLFERELPLYERGKSFLLFEFQLYKLFPTSFYCGDSNEQCKKIWSIRETLGFITREKEARMAHSVRLFSIFLLCFYFTFFNSCILSLYPTFVSMRKKHVDLKLRTIARIFLYYIVLDD